MTAMLAFLRIAWPYLVTAGIGGFISHELDQIPYGRKVTELASYKAQVANANEKAQKAAADALQAQINTRLTTEARNGQIVAQLTQERDSAALDRDIAVRLLNAASRAAPSRPVPQTAGGQPVTPAGPANSGGSLTQELAAAIGECKSNSDQLDALISEIRPQL